jgi:hypothetical protein
MDNETAFSLLIAIKLNHGTGTKTGYGKLLTIKYKLGGKEGTGQPVKMKVLISPDQVKPKKRHSTPEAIPAFFMAETYYKLILICSIALFLILVG